MSIRINVREFLLEKQATACHCQGWMVAVGHHPSGATNVTNANSGCLEGVYRMDPRTTILSYRTKRGAGRK
jgi:hypothetical protein